MELVSQIEDLQDDLTRYGLEQSTGDFSNPTITLVQDVHPYLATEEGTGSTSPLDEVMEDTRRELVRRVAAADRDANRDVYDALETE